MAYLSGDASVRSLETKQKRKKEDGEEEGGWRGGGLVRQSETDDNVPSSLR